MIFLSDASANEIKSVVKEEHDFDDRDASLNITKLGVSRLARFCGKAFQKFSKNAFESLMFPIGRYQSESYEERRVRIQGQIRNISTTRFFRTFSFLMEGSQSKVLF